MNTTADILVHSPDHRLQLVVEVKNIADASPQWAASLRRNLLVHGAVPDAPYFLLALPKRLFLWKPTAEPDVAPDYVAGTTELLRDYLGSWFQEQQLSEESLELAVRAWLRDLTWSMRTPRRDSEADRMLLESGAYEAIHHGSVAFDT
jgi:hypothetical protein